MAGGVNLYAYAGGNPVSFSDPFGLCKEEGDPDCSSLRKYVEAANQWIAERINRALDVATALLDALTPGGDLVRAGAGIDPATGATLSSAQRLAAAGTGALKLAGMASVGAGMATDATATVRSGALVYRVFGGDAGAMGRSWTTANPASIGDFRAAAGLPTGNSGRFVAEGMLRNSRGVAARASLPGAGGAGGLPELVIPDAATRVQLFRVSGVNPPF